MSKNISFIFPGQGSQAVGMGKDFFENSKIAREMFESASDTLKIDMQKLLFTQNDNLNETEFSQPAILLVSLIALEIFKTSISIKPDFVLGHSLGEFSALSSVGAIDFLSAVMLVKERGLLMKKACEGKNAGMLVVLGLEDRTVEELCYEARDLGKQIWAANYNCDGQIVIAGIKKDLEDCISKFKDAGAKRAMLLPMSVASHCPILQDAKNPLKEKIQPTISIDTFSIPIVSNVNAEKYYTKNDAVELLGLQLVKPVLYKQSIVQNEVDVYIEFGASVLKGLNKKITTVPTLSISNMTSLEEAINYFKN